MQGFLSVRSGILEDFNDQVIQKSYLSAKEASSRESNKHLLLSQIIKYSIYHD